MPPKGEGEDGVESTPQSTSSRCEIDSANLVDFLSEGSTLLLIAKAVSVFVQQIYKLTTATNLPGLSADTIVADDGKYVCRVECLLLKYLA